MTRVLYDAFFHMMPGHRIGRNIAVGGYRMNFGRYSPGDCYHPNGLSFLEAELAGEYEIRLLRAPYSAASLYDADILFITNPDYPLYEGTTPWRWEPEDVDAVMQFAERGGGVILLINSFLSKSDFWEENFDIERVNTLLARLGVRWDANYMSDDKSIEKARAGAFTIGYGQGGRVLGGKLPTGLKPLITYKNHIYGFAARVGRGTLAVVGDAGMMSNGLLTFPGFDNAAFVRDLFDKIRPAWCRKRPSAWDYLSYAHISSAPSKNGLNEDLIRSLRPKAAWQVDHHYRHLTWDKAALKGAGKSVWEKLPVKVEALKDSFAAEVTLRGLCLDTDKPGPRIPVKVAVRTVSSDFGDEVHAIGRTRSTEFTWNDLSAKPERFRPAGQVERVSTVFEMRLVLDPAGQPTRARWSQGQFLFARNPASGHYGYEIILASSSGCILPRLELGT